MSVIKSVNYAPDAWKALNGIFCVYKPSGMSFYRVRDILRFNLCRGLNELEQRNGREMVSLKGSVCSKNPYEVKMVPNYADHELVSGPRYQEQDIRMNCTYHVKWHTSGVFLIGINNGCIKAVSPVYRNLLRRYEIKGQFGIATKTFMSDSKVYERSTYYHVKQATLDKVLASIQSLHQGLSFKFSGIDMQSQAAYDLASSGVVKPFGKSGPLIYSIKCTEFDLPYFTLDVRCINETEDFLAETIHDIGIDLRTVAVCTQLRQVQFGHFLLSHALLRKHWTLENILNNLSLCRDILNQNINSVDFRSIKAFKQNDLIENMQNKAREEFL